MSISPKTAVRQPRLLAVFAHPDDEVFCAGGLLARWVANGGLAMVVSATRGEAGQIQDACAATRQTLGTVRERELRLGCGHLGVRQIECLDYRDGALQSVGEIALAQHVAAYLRDFEPDIIVTFGPDGGYGHPDHIAISAATTLACQIIAREYGRAPQLYYSAFPRQHHLLCTHLAQWLDSRKLDFRGTDAFVRALTLLADEATELRYADDSVDTQWFPAGFAIVEQGELADSLYLVIAGHADVIQEDSDGQAQVIRRLGPGHFFGERALARHGTHDASVVARDTVTCLKLSSRAPTAFDGRGTEALLGMASHMADGEDEHTTLFSIDVSADLDRKIAALAAHRTQFAFEATMFPVSLMRDLLGTEFFERAAISNAAEGCFHVTLNWWRDLAISA
jgi:LmbE family N-acetylglucosaminyl deacetylase